MEELNSERARTPSTNSASGNATLGEQDVPSESQLRDDKRRADRMESL